MSLDYEALMEAAKKNARAEAEHLYPSWRHEEIEAAYENLVKRYYQQYTSPPRYKPVTLEPVTLDTQGPPPKPLTEEDVRRIVREEITNMTGAC